MFSDQTAPFASLVTDPVSLPEYHRYILAEVGSLTILFPDGWLNEILLVDRSAILPLPFYDSAILGMIHHQGSAIPVLSLASALDGQTVMIPERLTVMYLTRQAAELRGAGLTVDRVVGSMTASQYAQMLDERKTNHKMTYLRIEELTPKLPPSLWQPRRWIGRL